MISRKLIQQLTKRTLCNRNRPFSTYTNTLVRIGIYTDIPSDFNTFCQNVILQATLRNSFVGEDFKIPQPFKNILSSLLLNYYTTDYITRVPNADIMTGEFCNLELINKSKEQLDKTNTTNKTEDQDNVDVPINAALLLVPANINGNANNTKTNKMKMNEWQQNATSILQNVPPMIPINILLKIQPKDITKDKIQAITKEVLDLQKFKQKGNVGNVYSIRHNQIDDGGLAWKSLFLAQHSVLYPTNRLVGDRFNRACGIIFTSCSKNGKFDLDIFARVVFGYNTAEDESFTTQRKKDLLYPDENPSNVKDISEWFNRLVDQGQCALGKVLSKISIE